LRRHHPNAPTDERDERAGARAGQRPPDAEERPAGDVVVAVSLEVIKRLELRDVADSTGRRASSRV